MKKRFAMKKLFADICPRPLTFFVVKLLFLSPCQSARRE